MLHSSRSYHQETSSPTASEPCRLQWRTNAPRMGGAVLRSHSVSRLPKVLICGAVELCVFVIYGLCMWSTFAVAEALSVIVTTIYEEGMARSRTSEWVRRRNITSWFLLLISKSMRLQQFIHISCVVLVDKSPRVNGDICRWCDSEKRCLTTAMSEGLQS